MSSRWKVIFIALWVLAFPFPVGASMYMVSYEPNWDLSITESPVNWAALYTVDYLNGGSVTKVGDIVCEGNNIVLTDIAFNKNSQIMYGINCDDTGSQLYSLDYQNPVAGVVQATLLYNFDVQNLEGLVGDPGDGTLCAGSGTDGENPGTLYSIDPFHGTIEVMVSLGSLGPTQPIGLGYEDNIVFGGDLEVDSDNTLYGSVSSATADHSADIFSLANIDDEGATLVGEAFPNAISGLAFVWPSTMYACDYFGAFYKVNLYDGTLTFLGNNGVCQVGLTYVNPAMETRGSLPAILPLLLNDH